MRSSGGRYPPADPIGSIWKSLVNFDRLYRPIATTWRLYDGSAPGGQAIVAHGAGAGAPTIVEAVTWREIERQMKEAA